MAAALRAPFFNLELHGIDLCDADADDIPPALIARQPDLRRPLAHKLAALDETLAAARAAGARFATLADAAAFQRRPRWSSQEPSSSPKDHIDSGQHQRQLRFGQLARSFGQLRFVERNDLRNVCHRFLGKSGGVSREKQTFPACPTPTSGCS